MGAVAALIDRTWTFVSTPANMAVLVALAGGIGFAWNKFSASPVVTANVHSVRVGSVKSANVAKGAI